MAQPLRLPGLRPPSTPYFPLPSLVAAPPFPAVVSFSSSSSISICQFRSRYRGPARPLAAADAGGDGGGGGVHGGDGNKGGGGSSGGGDDVSEESHRRDSPSHFGLLGFLVEGWRSRVSADPQFPFKLLMEELVGVTACVIGDMSSRPNFGLNELDFVFSTLVVGSILNFALMYLLAPTSASSASALPGLFAACPQGHMFEPGAYSLADRLGTFVYKGIVFAAVGFAAGLTGTAISNGLISLRKRMDPTFETPNKPPPTLLNSLTWAAHMGVSSNLRYQSLNGIEFLMAKVMPPPAFKMTVLVLRSLNNVLGGFSFGVLAKLTGAQKPEKEVGGGREQGEEKVVSAGSENGG
ncbi:unnamed protein product [Spirodela intermedia]|uniref:Uncharacterized protein n=1 Tax=Spirodela intermedia TaxID=51605 RepID=A0A7I8L7Y2_SPIIN|nr:unnamed protein product [Spirodela intermedia]